MKYPCGWWCLQNRTLAENDHQCRRRCRHRHHDDDDDDDHHHHHDDVHSHRHSQRHQSFAIIVTIISLHVV